MFSDLTRDAQGRATAVLKGRKQQLEISQGPNYKSLVIYSPNPLNTGLGSHAFARFQKGNFGWGVVVPGYNFTVAGTSRPLNAAASAALATRGVFAPLLLTDDAKDIPKPLEEYLLSVQPGYEDDPGQAVYNRVWLLGDDKQISVAEQARIDQITELIPVQANAP